MKSVAEMPFMEVNGKYPSMTLLCEAAAVAAKEFSGLQAWPGSRTIASRIVPQDRAAHAMFNLANGVETNLATDAVQIDRAWIRTRSR